MNTAEAVFDGDIRVLIISDVRLYREGLASLLRERPHFTIMGATDVVDTINRTSALADVVIIEIGQAGRAKSQSSRRRRARSARDIESHGGRARCETRAAWPEHGQLLTGNLADYLIPTSTDFPRIRAIALENHPSPSNRSGSRAPARAR